MAGIAHQQGHAQHGRDVVDLGLRRMRPVDRHQHDIEHRDHAGGGRIDQQQRKPAQQQRAQYDEDGGEQLVRPGRGKTAGIGETEQQEQPERFAVPQIDKGQLPVPQLATDQGIELFVDIGIVIAEKRKAHGEGEQAQPQDQPQVRARPLAILRLRWRAVEADCRHRTE